MKMTSLKLKDLLTEDKSDQINVPDIVTINKKKWVNRDISQRFGHMLSYRLERKNPFHFIMEWIHNVGNQNE